MSRIPLSAQDTEDAVSAPENHSSSATLDTPSPDCKSVSIPVQPISSGDNTSAQVCSSEKDTGFIPADETGMMLLQSSLSNETDDIQAKQLQDPVISEVYKWVQQNHRPYLRYVRGKMQRKLWWQFPKLVLCNVYYVGKHTLHQVNQLFIKCLFLLHLSHPL